MKIGAASSHRNYESLQGWTVSAAASGYICQAFSLKSLTYLLRRIVFFLPKSIVVVHLQPRWEILDLQVILFDYRVAAKTAYVNGLRVF